MSLRQTRSFSSKDSWALAGDDDGSTSISKPAAANCGSKRGSKRDSKRPEVLPLWRGCTPLSYYENGKTKPPSALVKPLKLLQRHPDLPDEIRAA